MKINYDKEIANLERKIENQQKEIELFRKAFAEMGVMLSEEKSHPICGMAGAQSAEGKRAKEDCHEDAEGCEKDCGLRKPNGIFIPAGFTLAYAAGCWTIILIQVFVRLFGRLIG